MQSPKPASVTSTTEQQAMNNAYKVAEDIFDYVVQALAQLADYASNDLKPALDEHRGALMLWRGGFQKAELLTILDASVDIALAILRNLYIIGGIILRLSKLGKFSSTLLSDLIRTRNVTSEYVRLQALEGNHEVMSIEDEDEDNSSDDSENEMETNMDSLRLHVKHLMRLTPTMERLLADALSTRSSDTLNTLVERSSRAISESKNQSEQAPRTQLPSFADEARDRDSKGPQPVATESPINPMAVQEWIKQALAKQGFNSIVIPVPPQTPTEMKFDGLLSTLSAIPVKYENPGLLDEALTRLPLNSIYETAEEEHDLMKGLAASFGADAKPQWGSQDAVIRALLRWFKREFFEFVNNPACSRCRGRTTSIGMTPPTQDEAARGATRVELYHCSNLECRSYERFPRYSDVWTLLETRRGRSGEFANCFTMLCRAVGSRVRWVWSSEDAVWTEVYSDHQRRWVHVDPIEELWDIPTVYTRGWGRKFAYCIAFSSEGATDVTRRYVRDAVSQLPRTRVSESVLLWIVFKLRHTRRKDMSRDTQFRLMREDEREERELRNYITQSTVAALLSVAKQIQRGSAMENKVDSAAEGNRQTVSF